MPSPRSTASKLLLESPEHITYLTFGRYPYLHRGLPYTLEVVTHVKKRNVSLKLETFVHILTQEQI